ncbi:MAG TPA: hypothetical protein VEU62_00985 [Bryobacterales bacterium]|nr:hypothetical protein [Bryobacterales bacterium]
MPRLIFLVLLVSVALRAAPGGAAVYVVLWFDTEDYIEPAADDAALRLATDLDRLGVHATFKVVGEKARTLEARGRVDVIRALSHHSIGYHSNYHSIPPAPALYLRDMGYVEGAAEFERRERPGVADLRRIFGVTPVCYGQPGNSWAPQTSLALRRMGIPVYLDEGTHVGVGEQPFWYGGLLYIFNMGRFLIRPELNDESQFSKTMQQFDADVAELARRGGGVISTYYHPTEFVTTEFWDAVNFSKGANPERRQWQRPQRRTAEDSERCYAILRRYVEHAKQTPGVRFATASEMLQLYESSVPPHVERSQIAAHLAAQQTFLETARGSLSAADMLLELLGIEPQVVDGPTARRESTYHAGTIPRPAFERAKADAASFIRRNRRLPGEVWIGSERLSIGDFAATLAGDDAAAPEVPVRKANLEMEKYFSTDAAKAFDWVIHPAGFRAPELLELGKLQGWTLKPARLR